MSLQSQLENLSQKQRVEFLDNFEQSLKEKESILNEPELITRVSILNKQIDIKNQTILNIEQRIDTKLKELKIAEREYDDEANSVEFKTRQINNKLISIQNSIKTETANLKDAKSKVAEQLKDIQSNKQFLKEQEKLIDDTISDGNIRFREIDGEIRIATEERENLLKANLLLKDDSSVIEREISLLTDKLIELTSVYDNKVQILNIDLKTKRNEIANLDVEQQQKDLEFTGKFNQLNMREKQLDIKDSELYKKDIDLKQREKYLSMKLGLIGVE